MYKLDLFLLLYRLIKDLSDKAQLVNTCQYDFLLMSSDECYGYPRSMNILFSSLGIITNQNWIKFRQKTIFLDID